jgi:excinuclease ABC subunit C
MTVSKPPAGTIPTSPGSYQFKDELGRVLYVGKASNLRSRLANYFQDLSLLHPRTAAMVTAAHSVEWIEVRNELEALMLEYSLIKQHRPRFNVRLMDDKSYPFLAITIDEQWPRAVVMRGTKRKGTRYFGPYAHAWAIRETLDLLLRTFPVRTCSQGKFNQHQKLGKPCLLFHIEKCSGPCVNEISPDQYAEHVQGLTAFLDGDNEKIVDALQKDMFTASENLEFEKAARLRDRLGGVRRAIETQLMVGERSEDFDLIGSSDDDLEAAVQVFYVRKGRVVGRKGFILDKAEELSDGALVEEIIKAMYGEEPPLGVPGLILVTHLPEYASVLEQWLAQQKGSLVELRVPQRGDKKTLMETVVNNAREEFVRHRMKRASDHNARSRALSELQEVLDLPEAPLRIECYDMAHLQGTDYVGSMVVMEDGLPNKKEYRRFRIKDVAGNNDYAAMREVLHRRLSAYISERDNVDEERESRPKKFAYPPQLLLVDGGKGQLGVAIEVINELGLADEIPVAAIAKRFEEIYVPGRSEPIRIPRGSDSLFLLQRIRDEAHRFANTFHRESRSKRMIASTLEGIDGLGEARAKRLIKELGSVKAIRASSLEELGAISWLPEKVALNVFTHLHKDVAAIEDTIEGEDS